MTIGEKCATPLTACSVSWGVVEVAAAEGPDANAGVSSTTNSASPGLLSKDKVTGPSKLVSSTGPPSVDSYAPTWMSVVDPSGSFIGSLTSALTGCVSKSNSSALV